jgi:hypothetical protein
MYGYEDLRNYDCGICLTIAYVILIIFAVIIVCFVIIEKVLKCIRYNIISRIRETLENFSFRTINMNNVLDALIL